MCTSERPRRGLQTGVSLLELIAAMVVISVALAAVASVFVVVSRGSADPMARQQAQFIAEAYLEEILQKRFFDPEDNVVCQAPAAREPRRDLFDNVCDYDGISIQPPADQFGNAIPNVSGYTVTVAVDRATPALNGLNNTGANRVLRVDVTVSGPGNASVMLTGYRTNYTCSVAGDPGCVP